MTREQLDEIIAKAPELLREKLGELHDAILQSAAQSLAESQDSETGGKPKVRIGCAVIIELNQATPVFSVEASVATRTKVVSEAVATRDPNQPELDIV